MNALLEANGLRFSYRDKVVLDVDRLEVMPGEILAILGANGAGKSTLFRMLLQLERGVSGSVIARGRVAGVFQRPYLFEGTVADNLAYGLRGRHAARVQAVAEAFQLTALLQQRVRALSGGEAQRVALARALVMEPDVLLLDEPTANLDAPLRRQFREDLLRAVRAHAGAVVLITHDAADAFGVADRIAVLEAGRIVQAGTPDELLAEPGTPFVAAFTGAELLLNGSIAAVAEDLVQVALLDGGTIWAAWTNHYSGSAQKGARVHVAYRPEDVVLASIESSAELSARNQYRLRVASLTGSGGLVRLRLEGQPNLAALITRTSCESLALRPGREVVAHLKATALRALPV